MEFEPLLLFALAGFCASFVDGALGMGFGPTSSSILLGSGLSPASVSTSVNIVKVATGIAAAVSHWRFGNIDRKLVLGLALPGMAGALVGATLLSSLNGAALKPALAGLLMLIGLRILFRFARLPAQSPAQATGESVPPTTFDRKGLHVVAACGGVTNGMIGAWGPVVTPFLLHRGLAPRYAIGSVNTAEVAVASASAVSLIAAVGRGGVQLAVVIAMLIGGVIAAPVAAWAIRFVPARPLGIAVAGLLLLTNARELVSWSGLTVWSWWFYAGIVALVALAAGAPTLTRAARRSLAPTEPSSSAPTRTPTSALSRTISRSSESKRLFIPSKRLFIAPSSRQTSCSVGFFSLINPFQSSASPRQLKPPFPAVRPQTSTVTRKAASLPNNGKSRGSESRARTRMDFGSGDGALSAQCRQRL